MSDIAVRYGYVPDENGGREPAMGVYPIRLGRPPIYAIPLHAAYKYTDTRYLCEAAFKMASLFGMAPDQFLINRIADTVLAGLDKLVGMRPADDVKGQAFAEGVVRIDGDEVERFEAYTGGGIEK